MRKSTGKQEMSIETQRKNLQDYCELNDIDIVGEFVDEGVSGRKDPRKRIGMNQLLDSINKEIDYVLVFKIDRISRNYAHLGFIETVAEGFGAIVLSLQTEENERMYRMVYGIVAEQEAQNDSQRVKAGMKMAKLKGHYSGGRPPYGYEYETGVKKLSVSEKEAIIIKMVFELKKKRYKLSQISRTLREKGHVNRDGKQFHPMTIKRILDRKHLYTGEEPFAPAIL